MPSTDDRAARRVVEPAREVQQRRLAGAGRPHHRDELAGGCTLKLTTAQRVHAVSPLPCTRLAPRDEQDGHRATSQLVGLGSAVGRMLCRRPRLAAAARRSPGLAVVEPAHLGLRLEDHRRRATSRQALAVGVADGLEPGVLLQRADRLGPLGLDTARTSTPAG